MMDNKTVTAQVLHRAAQLKRQQARRKQQLAAAGAVVASFMVVLCLSLHMPTWMAQVDTNSFANDTAAATLLSTSPFLGYMVVGVIAFVLGAFITVLAYRSSGDDDKKE